MSKRIDYKRVAPEAVKALGATKFYLDTTGITPRLRACSMALVRGER